MLESDLAWAPTHTLTNPFTEVVDHSAATSILAAGPGIGIRRSGTRHLSRTVARHDQEETRSCFVIRGLVGGNNYSGGRRNTVGETQLHFYTDWEKPPSSTEH